MVKTKYRKFATGGAVDTEAPTPEPIAELDPSVALRNQIDALRRSERAAQAAQRAQPVDPLEHALSQLPPLGQTFLRANPRFLTDAGENAKIVAVDAELSASGMGFDSPGYWAEMEQRLVNQPPAAPTPAGEVYEASNSRIVFDAPRERRMSGPLPPSRERDTIAGRYWSGESKDPRRVSITLTPAMKESARISGISELEYSKQLIRLREEKERGLYTGGQ